MRILVAAEEAAGVRLLRALAQRPHEVVGVLTAGRGGEGAGVTPWDVAAGSGLPTWPAGRVAEPGFEDEVRRMGVDLLLNVHSLHVMPGPVVDAPRLGSFNLHPGPLPRYAGLDVVSWAILNGETSHGVTIHRMVSRIDAGPIAYEERFEIGPADTALTVNARCATHGVALMLRLVDTAAAGEPIPAIEQDLTERRFFRRGAPDGGRLCWAAPAAGIVRFVRACDFVPLVSPWGHPSAKLGDVPVGIVKATPTGQRAGAPPGTVRVVDGPTVQVAAADEWVSIAMVKVGDRYADPAEVLHEGDTLGDG